jgi:hypothetical protein
MLGGAKGWLPLLVFWVNDKNRTEIVNTMKWEQDRVSSFVIVTWSSFSTCKSCHCWGPDIFRPNAQKSARNSNLYYFCHSAKKLTVVSPFFFSRGVNPLNTVLVGVYPLNTVLVGEYPLNTVLVGAYPLYTVFTEYLFRRPLCYTKPTNIWPVHLLGRQLAFSLKAWCLRVSKTESYSLSFKKKNFFKNIYFI